MAHRLMQQGVGPAEILSEMAPGLMEQLGEGVREEVLWRVIVELLSEPEPRPRLPQHSTLDDAVQLIRSSQRILVLTGAGISVSCGIPDFRSKEGIYSRLHVDFPDLPDPTAMFDIHYFRRNPRPFFQFAKEIYPGQFEPSLGHRFIAHLEQQGKLLRNYTQNIDTLEQVAGIQRVVQCHGSFATASCCVCKHRVDCDDVRDDIFAQRIPRCPRCPAEDEMAILKPDIVFFGENLPDHFHEQMAADKDAVDLLIVIGSSLKVRPVALIPSSIPPEVPQILIDRQPLNHMSFDVELFGYCDGIIDELLWRLGDDWRQACSATKQTQGALKVVQQLPPFPTPSPSPSPHPASPAPKKARTEEEEEPSSAASSSGKTEAPEPSAQEPEADEAEKTEETAGSKTTEEEGGEEASSSEAAEWRLPVPRRALRNLGSLLEAGSLYYDPQHRRTLFEGCVVYEDDSDSSSASSSPRSGTRHSDDDDADQQSQPPNIAEQKHDTSEDSSAPLIGEEMSGQKSP